MCSICFYNNKALNIELVKAAANKATIYKNTQNISKIKINTYVGIDIGAKMINNFFYLNLIKNNAQETY